MEKDLWPGYSFFHEILYNTKHEESLLETFNRTAKNKSLNELIAVRNSLLGTIDRLHVIMADKVEDK